MRVRRANQTLSKLPATRRRTSHSASKSASGRVELCRPKFFTDGKGPMQKRFGDKKVDRDWLNTNFPCMMACPAHTNAGRYVELIAEGEFEEAYRVARDPNPMASICGRVCAHPCETAGRRGGGDKPIAIRALKRFLTERYGPESRHPLNIRRQPASKLSYRVAIIGSGPVGLS